MTCFGENSEGSGINKLSVKGQTVNIFGFVGHMVSVATTPRSFVCYNTKAAMNNIKQMGVAVF